MDNLPASLKCAGLVVGLLFFAACRTAIAAPSPESETITTIARAEIDPKDPDYLRAHLTAFGLIPLAEIKPHSFVEQYRFLWVRSFHPAALFEVDYAANGDGTYRASVFKDHRWVVQKTLQWKKDKVAFDPVRRMVRESDMFNLAWYDNSGGYDGSSWYIELVRGEQHHEIYRWSPENGPIYRFGKELVDAAIDSPFLPFY